MREYLEDVLKAVLGELGPLPADLSIEFQTPANPGHGDLATNIALRLAKPFRKSPRDIAAAVKEGLQALPLDPDFIASVDVAGPGFLNFHFSDRWLHDGLGALLARGSDYGRNDTFAGQTAIVEFVSANPTGPLTVGHGRNAVLGDTLATLLTWVGYNVSREYYFNDAGRQMRVLGQSVRSRALSIADPTRQTRTINAGSEDERTVPEDFPDDGYVGDYITAIASELLKQIGTSNLDAAPPETFEAFARETIFEQISNTLSRIGVHIELYFNERSLYDSGKVWEVVDRLRDKDLVYDLDGAVWFRTTLFGKDKDTVLVKSTGEPTYRLPDIAYHADKLDRGFDLVLDLFGADHVATYPDVLSGLKALDYDTSVVDVVIYQFVTFVRNGVPVKMSTRKATYVTLDELIDEVGADVTRFFFLMRTPGTHLEFDLDLAKEARDKNPVFYLQYAHARICSILRKVEEVGLDVEAVPDFDLLSHDAEVRLIKSLLEFPGSVLRAAVAREPHRVINYLNEAATAFSGFYDRCRILGEETELAVARIHLAKATQIVLRNGLAILGISAPVRM